MDSTTFGAVGALYAAAFGVGLLRVRRSTWADGFLSALCAIAATAIGAIIAQHDGRLAPIEDALERIELTASLLAGPLMLAYVAAVWRRRAPRALDAVHAIPAVLSLAIVPAIEHVVAHQIVYTIASAVLMLRARRMDAEPFHANVSRGLLLFFAAVHVSQMARFAWSDVGVLRNIVPVSASAAILILGVMLAVANRRERPAPQRYANAPLPAADATRCLERLEAAMQSEALYRDPALSLPALAAKLGVTPHLLSQSLNQHRGTTLIDYLAEWRVAEAKRQLLDPARDGLTIDAIAETSGFGSRSAFYTAFRRIIGVTPSELRKSR
ncbi:MAG TPA: helix-turn-helix transcriptional regulator [Thermoanaerobaculia bacterium]|nr:helix-turn-helix transcriptional regulator [Thermoanaerobaculia bacterium]